MTIKIKEKTQVKSAKEVYEIFVKILQAEEETDRDKEHFWAMGLDTGLKIKYIELVSLGILGATLMHPRETFRMAIMKGVDSIIVAHNHPAGTLKFSEKDIIATGELKKAGEIIGIKLNDHILITNNGYLSAKTENII